MNTSKNDLCLSALQVLKLTVPCAAVLILLPMATTAAKLRYVDVNSLLPSPPYTPWATAASNIQQAVDAAVAGDEIVVTNGTYSTGGRSAGLSMLINRVVVEKPVTIRSVNGPELTLIEGYRVPSEPIGPAAVRCVYLCSGAVLSGFTLTNGATFAVGGDLELNGGGAWCESETAVLTNCILIGNVAVYGGGASGGTLNNCTLRANSAIQVTGQYGSLYGGSGGGAYSSALNGCLVLTNSGSVSKYSRGGGGVFYGRLNNCTLLGNLASFAGGSLSATLNNCILRGNGGAWDYNEYGGNDSLNYCCTTRLPLTGSGNITSEPRFVAADKGDFRLRPDSPCIDAGTNLPGLTTDIRGLLRLMDGNCDGIVRVDIGAYEFNPYQFDPMPQITAEGLRFTIRGEPGPVRIECSRDLVGWEFVAQVTIPDNRETFVDRPALTEGRLFYRAVRAP